MKTDSPSTTSEVFDNLDAYAALDSLSDGAYITDVNRRIVFWNHAAARITGWRASEVVGRSCGDNILVHIDKDGHQLCGHEHCPLHRSIVTGSPSPQTLLVFAQSKAGPRIPVEVSVAPIRSREGEIVGGVEVFRDLTIGMQDLLRAKAIQTASLPAELPQDARVAFEACYQPCEILGGDFYQVEPLDEDRYVLLVADVMGHGVASALYTMQIRSLWEDHREALADPLRFMSTLNERLHVLVQEAGYFATALFALYDAKQGLLRSIRAGHPAPLLFRAAGGIESIGRARPALGMIPGTTYEETTTQLDPGDTLLIFSDGAIELEDADQNDLGVEGLKRLAGDQAADPSTGNIHLDQLEEALLRFSNEIHLQDDLTLLKLHRKTG